MAKDEAKDFVHQFLVGQNHPLCWLGGHIQVQLHMHHDHLQNKAELFENNNNNNNNSKLTKITSIFTDTISDKMELL
jgi:hypothetical protein